MVKELRRGRSRRKSCTPKLRTSRKPTLAKSTVRGAALVGVEAHTLLPLLPPQQQRLVSGVSAMSRKDTPLTETLAPNNSLDDAVSARINPCQNRLLMNSDRDKFRHSRHSAKFSRTTRLVKQARDVLKRRKFSAMRSPRKVQEVCGDEVENDTSSMAAQASSIIDTPVSITPSASQIEASEYLVVSDAENHNLKRRDFDHASRRVRKSNSSENLSSPSFDVLAASANAGPLSTVQVVDENEYFPVKMLHSSSKPNMENTDEDNVSEKGRGDLRGQRRKHLGRSSLIRSRDNSQANIRCWEDKVKHNKKLLNRGDSDKGSSAVSDRRSRPLRNSSPNRNVHPRSRSRSEEKRRRLSHRRRCRSPKFGTQNETSIDDHHPHDSSTKGGFRPVKERRANWKPLRFFSRSRLSGKANFECGNMYNRRRRVGYLSDLNRREHKVGGAVRGNKDRSFFPSGPRIPSRTPKVESSERRSSSAYSRHYKAEKKIHKRLELQHTVPDISGNFNVGKKHVRPQARGKVENTLRLSPKESTFIDQDSERLALERKRLLDELKVIEELETTSSHMLSENQISVPGIKPDHQETMNNDINADCVGSAVRHVTKRKRESPDERNIISTPSAKGSITVVDGNVFGAPPAKIFCNSRNANKMRVPEEQVLPPKNGGNNDLVLPDVILDKLANPPSVTHSATVNEVDSTIEEVEKCSRNNTRRIKNPSRMVLENGSASRISRPRFVNIMDDTIDKIVKSYNENNASLSPVPSEASLLHFLDRSVNESGSPAVTFKNALDMSNCNIAGADGDVTKGDSEGQLVLGNKAAVHAAPDWGDRSVARQRPDVCADHMHCDRASSDLYTRDLGMKNTRQIRRIHPTPVQPDTLNTPLAVLKSQVVELVPVKEYTLKPKLRLPTSSTEVISSNRLSFESSSRLSNMCSKKLKSFEKSTEISDDERDIGNSDSSDSITDVSEVSKDSFIAKTSDEEILTSSKANLTFLNLDLSLSADSNERAPSRSKSNFTRIDSEQGDIAPHDANLWAESPAKNTRSQKHLHPSTNENSIKASSSIREEFSKMPRSQSVQPISKSSVSQSLNIDTALVNNSFLHSVIVPSCEGNAVESASGSCGSSSSSTSSSSSSSSSVSYSASGSVSQFVSNDPDTSNHTGSHISFCRKESSNFDHNRCSSATESEVTVKESREENELPVKNVTVLKKFEALFACENSDEGSCEIQKNMQVLRNIESNIVPCNATKDLNDCDHPSSFSLSSESLSASKSEYSAVPQENDVRKENQIIQKRLKLVRKKRHNKLSGSLSNSMKVVSIIFNEKTSKLDSTRPVVHEQVHIEIPNREASCNMDTVVTRQNSCEYSGMDLLKTRTSLQDDVQQSCISTPTLMKVRKRILTTPEVIGARVLKRPVISSVASGSYTIHAKELTSTEGLSSACIIDHCFLKGTGAPVLSSSSSIVTAPMPFPVPPSIPSVSSLVPVSLVSSPSSVLITSADCTVTLPLSAVSVAISSTHARTPATALSSSVVSCTSALSTVSVVPNSCSVSSFNYIKPVAGVLQTFPNVTRTALFSNESNYSSSLSDHVTYTVTSTRCTETQSEVICTLPCSGEVIPTSVSVQTVLDSDGSLPSYTSVFTNLAIGQSKSTLQIPASCPQVATTAVCYDPVTSNTEVVGPSCPAPITAVHSELTEKKSNLLTSESASTPLECSLVSSELHENGVSSTSLRYETQKFTKVVKFSRKRRKGLKLRKS